MILIKYALSVLLYILLLPISTPAAFIVSTWTRPDDLDWGGWHFNVRSTKTIEWPETVIDTSPVTPWRVWGREQKALLGL